MSVKEESGEDRGEEGALEIPGIRRGEEEEKGRRLRGVVEEEEEEGPI